MVLRPGDVLNTGTPAGVALGRADGAYLREGDIVELEADGLGRQSKKWGRLERRSEGARGRRDGRFIRYRARGSRRADWARSTRRQSGSIRQH